LRIPIAIFLAATFGFLLRAPSRLGRRKLRGSVVAVPEVGGRPAFKPGKLATVAVALALAAAATLVLLQAGLVPSPIPRSLVRLGTAILGGVFVARAVGGFRLVALSGCLVLPCAT